MSDDLPRRVEVRALDGRDVDSFLANVLEAVLETPDAALLTRQRDTWPVRTLPQVAEHTQLTQQHLAASSVNVLASNSFLFSRYKKNERMCSTGATDAELSASVPRWNLTVVCAE
jgi:hypothetical protein